MKYLYYLSLAILLSVLLSCRSTLYVGQSKQGYLTFNDAPYRGNKENLKGLLIEEGKKFIDPENFQLPEDMMIFSEYEMYKYNLTKGFVFYKRNSQTFLWSRITFMLSLDDIKEITSSSDTKVIVTFVSGKSNVYNFLSPTFGHDEKWVKV